MLKHGILGLLNYGSMTGYEIREIFNKSLNFFWQAQSSQIYRELHTLEKNGWITMTAVEQSDKPNKNICSITESGKAELMRWICADNAVMETRLLVLMQVFSLETAAAKKTYCISNGLRTPAAITWPRFLILKTVLDFMKANMT